MSKNNICNNCGKQGHQLHQCKLPITSYGIILFRVSSDNMFVFEGLPLVLAAVDSSSS